MSELNPYPVKLIDTNALKRKIQQIYLPSDSLTAGILYDLISTAPPIELNRLTHADRIRSMSDEELAIFLDEMQNDALNAEGCVYGLHFPDDKETPWIDWLRQPSEEVRDAKG